MKEWLFGKSTAECALGVGESAEERLRGLNCLMALVLGVLACFLFSGVYAQIAGSLTPLSGVQKLLLGLLPVHGVMTLTLGLLFLSVYPGRGWLAALDLGRPPDGWRATTGAALRMLAWGYPASMALYAVVSGLSHLCGYKPAPSPIIGWLRAEPSWLWLALAGVGVAVLAPLAEELIFRLALHDAFRFLGMSPVVAAWGTALVFAAIHRLPAEVPALLFLGLLLQWRRRRDRSLWGALIVHAGVNGLSFVFLLVSR